MTNKLEFLKRGWLAASRQYDEAVIVMDQSRRVLEQACMDYASIKGQVDTPYIRALICYEEAKREYDLDDAKLVKALDLVRAARKEIELECKIIGIQDDL